MRIDKIFRIALPLLAGTALIGTGYSIFSFANLSTSSTFSGDSAPTISISSKAEVGNLSVSPVIATDSGEYLPYNNTNGVLVFMQSRIYFTFTHFSLVYNSGTDWEEGLEIPVTIRVDMQLPQNLADYVFSDSWNVDSDPSTGRYYYEFSPFEISRGSSYQEYLPIPVFFYRSEMSPISQKEYFAMQQSVAGEEISFVFTATLNG